MAKKKSSKKSAPRVARAPKNKYLPILLIVFISIMIVCWLLIWRNHRIEQKLMMMNHQIQYMR